MGADTAQHARQAFQITAGELAAEAARLFAEGYRLAAVAAHDDQHTLRVVYVFCAGPPDRRAELEVRLDPAHPEVPSLAHLSFPASRFEREFCDLFGIVPAGHPFLRRLVLHQHWPQGWHPMRHQAGPPPPMQEDAEPFPFVRVEGPGVYEIPVGPVHAGLIEPGHFRFSVAGETILKMKARLWFLHRGVERLFEGQDTQAAVRLAECISGDSAIAHNLAYCLAVEDACQIPVPRDAARLRALLLELERLYNHIADIGALCNDVGFGLAQARALTLREKLLRLNAEITGHRLLRGAIRPGHTSIQRLPAAAELSEIRCRFDEIVGLATSSTVVMDRFNGTATLSSQDALGIGTLGVVARASGLTLDARIAHPFTDLGSGFQCAQQPGGDVMARFSVRVDEARASLRLITELAGQAGALSATAPQVPHHGGAGLGIVEGWRGSTVHRVEVNPAGTLTRCKIVDPSFLNWPALSVALADTIVPDFPLANKSFNLSYAGNDL
ncbi:MAG TPA: NADH-quinone oxidoreductase subunit C [Streptosporangiaceae bacterium]|nr:NADH-quinone oxidoreductase subunit C [Streptosporangiaceae bacterium]